MKMIFLNTPCKEFYDLLIKSDCCQEGKEWVALHIGGTMDEMINALPEEVAGSWSIGMLNKCCYALASDTRRRLIMNVVNPKLAYAAYKRITGLSSTDKTLLIEKFEGKLQRRVVANGCN